MNINGNYEISYQPKSSEIYNAAFVNTKRLWGKNIDIYIFSNLRHELRDERC